jgi:hypothetical protein
MSVSVVASLRSGSRGREVLFQKETRDCSSTKRPGRLWDPICLPLNAYRGSFPGSKAAEVQNLTTPGTEVKGSFRPTPTTPYTLIQTTRTNILLLIVSFVSFQNFFYFNLQIINYISHQGEHRLSKNLKATSKF